MKQKFSILTIGLILILILSACGQFIVEPAADGSAETAAEPNLEATVEAMVAATRAAEIEPETEVEPTVEEVVEEADLEEQIAEQVEVSAEFMPQVASFNDAASAEWGAAFCPETILPICIRPYLIETFGEEQVVSVEIWATGDSFSASDKNLSISFDAYNIPEEERTNKNDISGSNCGDTSKVASHYKAGFGYINRHCFDSETPLTAIVMTFNGAGSRFDVTWPVGENVEPVGGYSYMANAESAPIDQPFNVGPSTITIHAIEDLGDAVKLDVTVQANANTIVVGSPEWIVIGSGINFATVDDQGVISGWDEGKMGAYELVGGEINPTASQTGSVVLSKSNAQSGLMIYFGYPTRPDDSKVFLLDQ